MKSLKRKTLAAILGIVWLGWLGSGCSRVDWVNPETRVNSMARPVIIVANNENGLIVQGADGEIAHWRESYFFAATLRESGLVAGDILIP